jgi:hypothetical protein
VGENRFLTEEEMVPIMAMLHPSEGSYARQQAEHLLNEVLMYTLVISVPLHSFHSVQIEQSASHSILFSVLSWVMQNCDVSSPIVVQIYQWEFCDMGECLFLAGR